MVSVVQLKTLFIISILIILTACGSPSRREQVRTQEAQQDIYAALKNDNIEYHEEEQIITKQSPEFLTNGINELRSLYFRKKYDEATDLSIRLLKLEPSLTEVYYWKARIAMDHSDFQQAYNMASKGLSYVEDIHMKRELERVQGQAQMGAR